ncbi:MAG: dienelactone hydrolase family protein [Acidobacteriota bacterium]
MSRPYLLPALALTTVANLLPLVAQEWAVQELSRSPRHHEWVDLPAGERSLRTFVVFPEVNHPVPAVIVIHENRGLSDWVRLVADRLAAEGYIAAAPDLLSGRGPGGGGTSAFPTSDAAREAIYNLDPNRVQADLETVRRYLLTLPACNGTVAVAGFCWGGSQTFRWATSGAPVAAAFVFYGSGPAEAKEMSNLKCSVYGFYGENDARINAGIPATEVAAKAAGKSFEPVIYPGVGHAFMRRGDEPGADAAAKSARDAAWQRWIELLRRLP